ncbi:MAG: serine/threonine-protein phosphatase [Bacteroidaceae bacterium]|nr:serine/threonine-protein phosphatase [Bacteroidaceae bacterium]
MNEAVRITFSGNTDLGMVRKNNEDAFVVMNVWDDMHVLAVAIDGVGGYEGGEVAAAIARDSIVQYLNENKEGEKAELLKRALVFANNNIYAERHRDAERSHMSCVLTAVLVDVAEQYINMAHVGDTRLYQYCDGEFVKLSHDHSVVGYREEIGDLTEEEAMHHPQRNVISRDVGSRYLSEEDDEYVEVNSFPLLPNSTLLLCSDGLCDMVTSAEMTAVISCDTSLEQKVSALISAANAAGGRDNVTVVLVEYCADDDGLLGVPDSSELVSVGEESEASASNVSVEEHETGTDKKTFFRRIRFPLFAAVIVAVAGVAFYFGTKYNDVTEGDNASVEIKGQSPCAVEPLPADTMEVDTLGTQEPQPIITEEV